MAADDGKRYWCKPLNNQQGSRVPITEQIVARFGALIGVAVCEPQLVLLDGIAGYEFRAGRFVEPGWAHGSLAVQAVLETRALENRSDDDNRVRQAGFFALHDWLAGSDAQWLYDTSSDNMYFSHDHGFYLTGPDWTVDTLQQAMAAEFSLGTDPGGLDADELQRLAENLEALTEEELESSASKIPVFWPVTDQELSAAVAFADARREAVAGRTRALVP